MNKRRTLDLRKVAACVLCLVTITVMLSSGEVYASQSATADLGKQGNLVAEKLQLEQELKGKSKQQQAIVLEEADPSVVASYMTDKYSDLLNLGDELSSLSSESEAEAFQKSNKEIKDIVYNDTYIAKDDKHVVRITALQNDGSEVSIELVDEREDKTISDSFTAAIVNKEYGDRRYTGSKTVALTGWPDAKVILRMGYTINKNKTMARRYSSAKDMCEGDSFVSGGFKTKITKARVTDAGVDKLLSNGLPYAWTRADYNIMTYKQSGGEYWGYTTKMQISASPVKFYSTTVDMKQEMHQLEFSRN